MKKVSAYFQGIQNGANERRCQRIFEAYKGAKWLSTGFSNDSGTTCVTYNVPDKSAQAVSDILVEAGFKLDPPQLAK